MISKRIKSLREELNMSQRELANKIDINYSVMNRIESNERPARDDEIIKIATALEVSTDFLLGKSDIRNPYNKDIHIEDAITAAAHKVGHTGELTEDEKSSIELAIQIALAKSNRNK